MSDLIRMTPSEIMEIADSMITVRWSPPRDIRVWDNRVWQPFFAGQWYVGMAYRWWGHDSLAEFVRGIANTLGGDVEHGNDCSSFVGRAWLIDERLTTATLAADAAGPRRYCRPLGVPGGCRGAGLRVGDACNLAGVHVILVAEVRADGVISAEQARGPRLDESEMRRWWSYDYLDGNGYEPLRRMNLAEDSLALTLSWPAVPGATWYYVYLDLDGHKWRSEWVQGVTTWRAPAGLPGGRWRWWVLDWERKTGRGPWMVGPDFVTPRPYTPGFTVVQGDSE